VGIEGGKISSESILGAFEKLQTATISTVMSVRLRIWMEQLGTYRMELPEIWYLSVFWKSVNKIQVLLILQA
jgi:hypothetical protein